MELTKLQYVALWVFGITAVFGAVANKTHFCSMGAISDWLHMDSKARMGAWFLAIGVAILGTQGLSLAGVIDLSASRYLATNVGWLGAVVGGLLFGVGMTLGAGCGQRNLVRVGGGNLKALVVLLVMGLVAYMTLRGLLALVRINVIEVTNLDLAARSVPDQGLASIIAAGFGSQAGLTLHVVVAAVVGLGFVLFAVLQRSFWENLNYPIAGFVIGACIVAAWFATGYLGKDDFEPVPTDSISFIAPTGETLQYLMTFTGSTINTGIAAVLGMISGSFVYAVASGTFRIETFSNRAEMTSHITGAILMGFGGVLSLGCTIGQGVTGMSTLGLSSAIALASIILGSALTMRVQYHLLDEKGFGVALRAALGDVRLMPALKEST